MTRENLFKAIRISAGFTVAFFLLRYVVQSSDIDLGEVVRTVGPKVFLLAFLCYGTGFFIASFRWFLLLRHIGVALPLVVVVRLALIGQFFNLFVPGGVGGDLIKMFYLKKESGERYPEAILTVLLDRIIGLMGLLLLALLAIALNLSILENSAPEMRAILAVVALAGCGGLGAVLLFLAWPLFTRFGGRLENLRSGLPQGVNAILTRVGQAFSLLRSTPSKVLLLLGIAMTNHLFATLSIMCIGFGVGGVEEVSFQSFLLTTQLSNLIGAVPITPGGLGGRDLALSFLLGFSGASETARGAIPLVGTSLLIAWSGVGGLALLWEKRAQADEAPGEAD